jgi:hypothetical protein
MEHTFKELDVVVLRDDVRATQYDTRKAIILPRGCLGTIVHPTIDNSALVEFSDTHGVTFALEDIPIEKLIAILHEPIEIRSD